MPRDLAPIAKEDGLQGMPELTKSPDDGAPPAIAADDFNDNEDELELMRSIARNSEKRDEVHPYVQTLTVADVESCVKLEEATFPAHERCTREKFQYRLTTCGELSLGLFTSIEPAKDPENAPVTSDTSAPVYSGAPERKAVLLGHIIATKTTNPTVTDNDMSIPHPYDENASPDGTSKLGHKEDGRTVCIHSLAVLPAYQKKGLGKTLMKAYLQRMESHGVGDTVALIAHDHLINYYESFGFVDKGVSECKFGGGGWHDMVLELKPEAELLE